jgi:hypothetical protein
VSKRYVLSEYVELAMGQAIYHKLEDASRSRDNPGPRHFFAGMGENLANSCGRVSLPAARPDPVAQRDKGEPGQAGQQGNAESRHPPG